MLDGKREEKMGDVSREGWSGEVPICGFLSSRGVVVIRKAFSMVTRVEEYSGKWLAIDVYR